MNHPWPKASVVVPAYNAERTIGPLLESLLDIDYADFEVIVVNDGSRDNTKAVVERYPVRLINQPNQGASAARDAGLRAATGDMVAYVDSDVTVSRDWLRNLIPPFRDPKVAATTGRTILLRNEKCTSWFRSLDVDRRYAGRRAYTRLANGMNSAFRRSVLLEVGGFDPAWYHAEDTQVSYRIWDNGYVIRYVPESIVYHVPEEDWRTFLRKRYRDAKAFTRILRTHPRTALIEDDFVTLAMKVQPPLFLALAVLAVATAVLILTPLGGYLMGLLASLSVVAILINVPEAVAVARASRRPAFFLKGLALGILRGFAWGAGLGTGGFRQIVRLAPNRRASQ